DNFVDSFVLPAGRLREPLSAIKRADIVIITIGHDINEPI
ncbi:unnamed protein product, partial [marine sediment metagenome]